MDRRAFAREITGALIREYVWNGWDPVAVIEGGVISFVRADHIGRPVFATNASGAKVWSATYTPFGGVHTSAGALPSARFPGQWFQSESGLHQNWMRDYDPTTGRYLEADPLGLIDGASVYAYVKQNPMRLLDPTGEESTRVYRLPEDPANLGPDWNPYAGHQYGQTYEHRCSPAKVEFHPGNPAEGGNGARDHYHYYPSGRQRVKDRAWGGTYGDHFVPGDFIEVTDCSCPEDFEEDPVTHISLLFLLLRGPMGLGGAIGRGLTPVAP